MSKCLCITGTGTDVGKTYLTGLIVKKLRESGRQAAYFKAAMSGNVRRADRTLAPGDALAVRTMAGIDQPLEEMCPYVYEHAYSPHLASRVEGNPVEMDVVQARFQEVCEKYDYVTVEGSGGILCPIRYEKDCKLLLEDVIRTLDLSCLIVAEAGLGAINQVVLTVAYMRSKKLPVKGLLINRFHPGDLMEEDNLKLCEELTGVPVLACVGEGDTALNLDAETLAALYDERKGSRL